MKRPIWLTMILASLLSLGLLGCGSDSVPTSPVSAMLPDDSAMLPDDTGIQSAAGNQDIVDTAIGAGQFGTLVAALQAASLEDALRGPGPFTVFAPTDEAFAALPAGLLTELLKPENKDKLQQVLLYHVVSGSITSSDLKLFQKPQTLEGSTVLVRKYFRGKITVDESRVILRDVMASNGVIHVIDKVLIPPCFTLQRPSGDIVDTAVNAGVFNTLVAAAGAADLVSALRGPGPLTVFAPTDDAFAKLPSGTVDMLLKPENKAKLQQLLLYHVLSGEVGSCDLQAFQRVQTLAGEKLSILKWKDQIRVNLSSVVQPDVPATNGVIHVIDQVLIPPGFLAKGPGKGV